MTIIFLSQGTPLQGDIAQEKFMVRTFWPSLFKISQKTCRYSFQLPRIPGRERPTLEKSCVLTYERRIRVVFISVAIPSASTYLLPRML